MPLQKVPSPATDARVRQYLDLRAKFDAAPDNIDLAQKLAHAYIDFGRHTGDIRYLGYAQAVIGPWTARTPPPIPIQVVDATILQSRHKFSAAREELRRIVKAAPNNSQAWLTLTTVALVQGDIEASKAACKKTTDTGGLFLGIACTAQIRAMTGHPEQAYAILKQIENGGDVVPDAIKSWVEGLMGDAANFAGKPKLAQQHYKKALAYTPGDNFLLAHYADFLLDRGQPQAALNLVKDYSQSDTSFFRRVLAEAALGMPAAQRDTWAMGARFAAMDLAGSHLYRREQSRFVLHLQHDPQRALRLAQTNWRVQRAPWDVRVYLESALAAHKPQAAQPALDFLQRTHMSTPQIDALVARVHAAIDVKPPQENP